MMQQQSHFLLLPHIHCTILQFILKVFANWHLILLINYHLLLYLSLNLNILIFKNSHASGEFVVSFNFEKLRYIEDLW